jgi:hypothetical protein
MSTYKPVPPLIPGSQLLSTLEVSKAKINTLLGDSLSTLNTWKSSVRAASTANIASLSGTMTVDGVSLVAGDSILLKNQSTTTQNGLYIVKNLIWQRKSNMPIGIAVAGSAVFINEGTANADKVFVCTNNTGSDIVGTDGLTFVALGAAQGTVNQIQVSDGAGNVVASAATSTVAGLLTGATGLVATTGNITATAGNVVITSSTVGLTLNSTKATATAATWAAGATLNARQGRITVTNANVAVNTVTTFVVTNNLVAADSLIFLGSVSNANTGPFAMEVSSISAGVSFTVRLVAPVALVGSNSAVVSFAIM